MGVGLLLGSRLCSTGGSACPALCRHYCLHERGRLRSPEIQQADSSTPLFPKVISAVLVPLCFHVSFITMSSIAHTKSCLDFDKIHVKLSSLQGENELTLPTGERSCSHRSRRPSLTSLSSASSHRSAARRSAACRSCAVSPG